MPQAKIKATSHHVTSIHMSFLQNGTAKTVTLTWGPRHIADAKAELRIHQGSLMDYSSVIERERLQELSSSSTRAATSSDIDMTDTSLPVDLIMEDAADWITEDDEDLQAVYDDIADGMQETHHHHFIQRSHDD
ncbi:hypothetical protein K439DRAFT_1617413 [Ramaria rubella]|nr:hypothetical protein K439DRAFT_1617413 [Ramaria rubella]